MMTMLKLILLKILTMQCNAIDDIKDDDDNDDAIDDIKDDNDDDDNEALSFIKKEKMF